MIHFYRSTGERHNRYSVCLSLSLFLSFCSPTLFIWQNILLLSLPLSLSTNEAFCTGVHFACQVNPALLHPSCHRVWCATVRTRLCFVVAGNVHWLTVRGAEKLNTLFLKREKSLFFSFSLLLLLLLFHSSRVWSRSSVRKTLASQK